jgi:hypothetical protein
LPATEAIEETYEERVSDAPVDVEMDWAGTLVAGIGEPAAAMRWTLGADNRFVFQAPAGWRRHLRLGDVRFVEFIPEQEGLVFRARHFYRETESRVPLNRDVGPTSVDFEEAAKDGWVRHTWTLLFSDGEWDLLAILDLFHLPNCATEAALVRGAIAQTVPEALFVPDNWDMQRTVV